MDKSILKSSEIICLATYSFSHAPMEDPNGPYHRQDFDLSNFSSVFSSEIQKYCAAASSSSLQNSLLDRSILVSSFAISLAHTLVYSWYYEISLMHGRRGTKTWPLFSDMG